MGFKIIMAVGLLPVLFIMFGGLYFEGRLKGNVLLGVTLWPGAWEGKDVQDIVRRFRREMKMLLLIGSVLFVLTCIPARDSIVVSTQMLWLLFITIAFFVPIGRGNSRLKVLKREQAAHGAAGSQAVNDGTDRKVYVDLKVAAMHKQKPFLKFSLAGIVLGLFPLVGELFMARDSFYGWWTEGILLVMFFAGGACFAIQYWFWHLSTDVVSHKSEVNIQLARVRQYQWGRFWSIMIACNSLFMYIFWYAMHQVKAEFFLIMAGAILYTAAAAVGAGITERNIRRVHKKYAEEMELTVEEDDYWVFGIFYYNKNDNRFMVNRRAGLGTTVNMAKPSGKIFMAVVCIGTAAVLLWAAGVILLEDFAPISLKISEQAVISSQYHEEYRIDISEIETAELVEKLPSMSKRVGSALDSMLKGSFLAEGYVSCKVCVRREKQPFLKLTAEDGMVYYFNDEDPQATEQTYMEIMQLLTEKQK